MLAYMMHSFNGRIYSIELLDHDSRSNLNECDNRLHFIDNIVK